MKTKIISIILVIFFSTAHSRADEFQFIPMSNNDGLSNSSVNTILCDRNGVTWFGTWDGLNSYDGASFKHFRPSINTPHSISNNIIRSIYQDEKGILWITTDYGINKYDADDNTFTPYYLGYFNRGTIKENSFSLTGNQKGAMLASAYLSGLFVYNPQKKQFVRHVIQSINTQNIAQLFFDKQDNLWIISNSLEIIQLEVSFTAAYQLKVHKIKRWNLDKTPQKIIYDNSQHIWIQYKDHSLAYIETASSSLQPIQIAALHNRELYAVMQHDKEYLMGTSNGLVSFEKESGKEKLYLPGVVILSIEQGLQNIIWIGSDTRGVYKMFIPSNQFTAITPKNLSEMGTQAVRAIYKSKDNILWIGTKGNGLISLSETTEGEKKVHKYTVADGLSDNAILSIEEATHQNFWIGTDKEGLNYYDAASHKIKTVSTANLSQKIALYSIYALQQSNDSTLWVGTSGNGLFKLTLHYTLQEGYKITKYTHYLHDALNKNSINNNVIYDIEEYGDSLLWIATRGGGLNRLNIQNGEFTAFQNDPHNMETISSDDVICLHIAPNNRLWIGTGAGINYLDLPQAEISKFIRPNKKDELLYSHIHGILTDDQNQVWLSTNKGIIRYNTAHGNIINYTFNDGLHDNEFADGAYFATTDKTFYMGGVNGLTYFKPQEIGISNTTPPLFLSGFKKENQPQPLSSIKNKNIELSYKENYFSFQFAILDYLSNEKCQLAYKLERNHNNTEGWINLGNSKEIILSNLSPDTYTLSVIYSNKDNVWSKNPYTLTFTIHPPWWNSFVAKLFYVICLILIAYTVFRIQKKHLKMAHRIEIDEIESTQMEKVHQAKLVFFTNIAHEFSNSITLIYGPCEKMINSENIGEKEKKYFYTIKRNAERMQKLILQLMEFRKAETGHLTLRFEPIDVTELIHYTLDNFVDITEQKKISLTYQLQPDCLWIVDRDALEKIIFNLLSNAYKYTPDNGSISLLLNSTKDKLYFSCTNSGVGITEENLKNIFNRFKILDNFEQQLSEGKYTRNGIGLAMCKSLVELLNGTISVKSKPGEETTFTVEIATNNPSVLNTTAQEKNITVTPHIPIATNHKAKILIVDDEQEIRELISDSIGENYPVEEAENGEIALEKINLWNPDLIICDVIMPIMNGLELIKQVKSDPATKHIPIILLSSKASIESQIEGIGMGADLYIGKPFHPAHLLVAIETILSNKENLKEYVASPLSHAKRVNGKWIADEDNLLLRKTVTLICANLDNENYNQDSLAQDLLMSRVQFYRKIKKLSDTTPAIFIRNIRLQEAEKRLVTTNKTVLEIMQDCGFRNKAYFYREFSKIYHCTPKEYQQKMRASINNK